jgi:hypothetical protein
MSIATFKEEKTNDNIRQYTVSSNVRDARVQFHRTFVLDADWSGGG